MAPQASRVTIDKARQWIEEEVASGSMVRPSVVAATFGIGLTTAKRLTKDCGIRFKDTYHSLTDLDKENKTATCQQCGPGTPIRLNSSSEKWKCAIRDNEYHRNRKQLDPRPRPHGLTGEEARLFREGKSCDICGATEALHVDHCHSTGVIRGVLCRDHNWALGAFKDNIDHLLSAARYLTHHKGLTADEVRAKLVSPRKGDTE